MASSRDYYDVLGVKRDANAEEIRKAYRRLARELHPDVNKAADAATRFTEVQEAYEVLSDAAKRKAYDRFGHAGVGVGQGPGPGGYRTWSTGGFGGGAGGPGGGIDPEAFSSIFEDLFGARGGPFGAGGATSTRSRRGGVAAQRGEDFRQTLTVSFMTAALGGSEQIRLGSADGAMQTIDVKVPAGVQTGEKLRVRGKGAPGAGGGEPGDLILEIEVGGHPWFRRDGLDVLVDVPITVAEATFGASVTVPMLQGSVDIKVPPGASSGQKLRVPGRGIAGARGRRGDFHAVVQIAAPRGLSEKGAALLKQLAGELQNPRETAPWAEELSRRRG